MEEKNRKNYCEVSHKVFLKEDTKEEVAYDRIIWHIGNFAVELKPASDKAKGILSILKELNMLPQEGDK